jgi:hypothetical protein
MNKTEMKALLSDLTKEQLVRALINTLENEAKLREELDKIKGIIR